LNSLCKSNNIKIDDKELLFHNAFGEIKNKSKSVFVSYPASGGGGLINFMKRVYRALFEYSKYFTFEIFLIAFISYMLLIRRRIKIRKK